MNDNGDLVGSYTHENVDTSDGLVDGFLQTATEFTSIADERVPDNWCGETVTNGINDSGVIAGFSRNGCAPYFYQWTITSPYTDFTTGALTYAGKGANAKAVYSVLEPRDIATNGIIVGTWHTWKDGVSGPDHGFVATP